MKAKRFERAILCSMLLCTIAMCGHVLSNWGPDEACPVNEIEEPKVIVPPGLWAERQPWLFELYNRINKIEDAKDDIFRGPYYPYTTKDMWTNCYPKIFYLSISPKTIEDVDTLKYNWQHDEIVSICHDDYRICKTIYRICETMMWSSCDTIYTRGNEISKLNRGADIGNTLYDRALIKELGYRDADTIRLKSEINGVHHSPKGYYSLSYYCKIKIENGEIKSYFLHGGGLTKKQYRELPEEEKAHVKLFNKSGHNNDL